jgi:Flp pilus assembly protein CpaB
MATASLPLSPARALRRPRRLDVRALFGLFLTLLAVGGSVAFWTAANDARPVVVATRDLPTGAVLGPDDLTVARVRVDDAMYRAAVPGEALDGLVGRVLAEPVHAQQLVVRDQLSTRPPIGAGQVVVALPVAPQSAVGGLLRPGDAVRVLATFDRTRPEARTEVVLPRAVVYDLGHDDRLGAVRTLAPDGGAPAARGPLSWVALLVTQDEIARVARARWTAELDVVLLPAGG